LEAEWFAVHGVRRAVGAVEPAYRAELIHHHLTEYLRMQLEYDLWQTKQNAGDLEVARFAPLAPTAC
jgi:hypothetical protein